MGGKKLGKKGFTLVEVIVVLVILGILAAVMIPSLTKFIDRSQDQKEKAAIMQIKRAVVGGFLEIDINQLSDAVVIPMSYPMPNPTDQKVVNDTVQLLDPDFGGKYQILVYIYDLKDNPSMNTDTLLENYLVIRYGENGPTTEPYYSYGLGLNGALEPGKILCHEKDGTVREVN